ncbi:MAG: helix-turn-helix domain-containing protein, partial [Alphaproteobacteria bacterium]
MTTKRRKRETHLVEWKESWRDEYLKWICGFANADGGTLVIGMNDDGDPVGAQDADRLLVGLPNKIRDMLGLVVPVRSISRRGKPLVEIEVDASVTPISYKGEYHYRSGMLLESPECLGAQLSRRHMGNRCTIPGATELAQEKRREGISRELLFRDARAIVVLALVTDGR